MMQTQEHVTRTARIWLDDDGIIRKVFLPNADETLNDALESAEIIRSLCEEKKRPLLVDFTPLHSMDSDARHHYAASSDTYKITAVAGITKSLLSRVIGNFFMGFNRPPTPGKIFNSEEDAMEWLKKFL